MYALLKFRMINTWRVFDQ